MFPFHLFLSFASLCRGVIWYSLNDNLFVANVDELISMKFKTNLESLSFSFIDLSEGRALISCPSLLEKLSEEQKKDIINGHFNNIIKHKEKIEKRRISDAAFIVENIFEESEDEKDVNGKFLQDDIDNSPKIYRLIKKDKKSKKSEKQSPFEIADNAVSDALSKVVKLEKSYLISSQQNLLLKSIHEFNNKNSSSSSDDEHKWVVSYDDSVDDDSTSTNSLSFSSFHKSSSSDDWSNSSGIGDSSSSKIDL